MGDWGSQNDLSPQETLDQLRTLTLSDATRFLSDVRAIQASAQSATTPADVNRIRAQHFTVLEENRSTMPRHRCLLHSLSAPLAVDLEESPQAQLAHQMLREADAIIDKINDLPAFKKVYQREEDGETGLIDIWQYSHYHREEMHRLKKRTESLIQDFRSDSPPSAARKGQLLRTLDRDFRARRCELTARRRTLGNTMQDKVSRLCSSTRTPSCR